MQPRLNIAKSAGELIEEEVRRFFINKSTDALKNMPVREILTSKAVEHINTYYKLGENDFITFTYIEDEERLRAALDAHVHRRGGLRRDGGRRGEQREGTDGRRRQRSSW